MSFLSRYKKRVSVRLKNWDYAKEAMYFITICTKNRVCYFGEIIERNHDKEPHDVLQKSNIVLQPTEMGEIARTEWYKTVKLRPDMNLKLGEFGVMPNHIHGIIMIGKNEYNIPCRAVMHHGPTGDGNITYKNQFGPQSKNLASIIRGYKSAVTTLARKKQIEFIWQSRFYEHIIRSSTEFQRISNYIRQNPAHWLMDRFYSGQDNMKLTNT
jgi:REP element-mobilizing transposase RayT